MTLPPEAMTLPANLIHAATILPDRNRVLDLLPKRADFAEVGVGFGDFSRRVLDTCQPRHFVAIDDFRLHLLDDLWGRTPEEVFGTATHQAFYASRFAEEIARGQVSVIEGESSASLSSLPDQSLDVVYVDADHRYEFVRRDLQEAARKVRPDGWIVVNDYIMVPTLNAAIPYGVVHATHEFMLEHDWGMEFLALHPRMFCDVVLRPSALLKDIRQETRDLREEVRVLRNSASWKMTRPLREVVRRLMRRR